MWLNDGLAFSIDLLVWNCYSASSIATINFTYLILRNADQSQHWGPLFVLASSVVGCGCTGLSGPGLGSGAASVWWGWWGLALSILSGHTDTASPTSMVWYGMVWYGEDSEGWHWVSSVVTQTLPALHLAHIWHRTELLSKLWDLQTSIPISRLL